ncbi:MAG: RsmB/NOP family class I SAM-dependent RNA methyltransferase [Pseudomonadota bacterium]
MRDSGRLAAAIEILDDFASRRTPLKIAIADWARGARYAGAKDRAWISGLCLDALRRRNSLSVLMGADNGRALAFGAMRARWGLSLETLAEIAAEGPHGPGALSEEEKDCLSSPKIGDNVANHIRGDFPEWLSPHIERAFGEDAIDEMRAFAERADIDLRINTLKAEPEQALSALKKVKASPAPLLKTAARIAAPPASEKPAAITVIPAFNKGWVEVQDLGSQIAAAAAGDIKGAQVLDYCAGGGGKTLALAALMENAGQIYAYDRDPRRLKPLFHRAKRAGARNLQIRSPSGSTDLEDLKSKMDVVFVDAPCSGAGTWRRHPDTKWRLTEKQLATRMGEQDQVLREAAAFVRPGGKLIWVTCSFLMEENEDRLAAFLDEHEGFQFSPVLDGLRALGLLTNDRALKACETADGALRLTPRRVRTDGFFIAVLEKKERS